MPLQTSNLRYLPEDSHHNLVGSLPAGRHVRQHSPPALCMQESQRYLDG